MCGVWPLYICDVCVQVGQFSDDESCSRLRTLIAHYPPAHMVTERGHTSQRTNSLLATSLAATFKETLASGEWEKCCVCAFSECEEWCMCL